MGSLILIQEFTNPFLSSFLSLFPAYYAPLNNVLLKYRTVAQKEKKIPIDLVEKVFCDECTQIGTTAVSGLLNLSVSYRYEHECSRL